MFTNAEFAKNDRAFRKACNMANVKPTSRQASKFQNKKGQARRFLGSATAWANRQNS